MSTGDGRHKLGSATERKAHDAISEATRVMVGHYCARRQREYLEANGVEAKKSVFQQEIAEHLGISIRQLSAYCRDVPITLCKALLLSRFCGDARLLQLFAAYMGAVAVALPTQDSSADPGRIVEELSANLKESAEAQQAALALMKKGKLPLRDCRAITKEAMESIKQLLRLTVLAEFAAHGEVKTPAASWARRKSSAASAAPFIDPTLPRDGWDPKSGFAADEPQ